ncbi:MAG: hypothetical protein LBL20_06475 [Treponema sp.]|jgi:hypothetical protein|nr:hypothetical protein [Treponema sp.]
MNGEERLTAIFNTLSPENQAHLLSYARLSRIAENAVKTFAKQITVPVAQKPANTGPTVTLLPDNEKFIVKWTAVEGATGYEVIWTREATLVGMANK